MPVKYLPYEHEVLNGINNNHTKTSAEWYALVIPALGRQRQEDLWPALLAEPIKSRLSERAFLKH